MSDTHTTGDVTTDKPAFDQEVGAIVDGVGFIPRDIFKYVASNPYGDLPRYSPHIVFQHLLVFLSFLVLSSTGVPLYFSDEIWAPYMISIYGGIDNAMAIHKIGAYVMIFASVYHMVTIVCGTCLKILQGRFDYRRTQIPRLKDLKDMIQDIKYFMGRAPHRPLMEKFMYKQKLHYLAIIWGTLVLSIAGMALLLPDTISSLMPDSIVSAMPGGKAQPGLMQDLARLMHADEAVMALIVLAFWHWGNVHFVPGRCPCQWTFLTGKITREHQIEEHFLEYLRNLKEIPAERRYMRDLLAQLGARQATPSPASSTQAGDLQQA